MRAGPRGVPNVRKIPVKVYLSKEQIEMLDRVCGATGEDRSTQARAIILNYFKDVNLIKEAVHSAQEIPDSP